MLGCVAELLADEEFIAVIATWEYFCDTLHRRVRDGAFELFFEDVQTTERLEEMQDYCEDMFERLMNEDGGDAFQVDPDNITIVLGPPVCAFNWTFNEVQTWETSILAELGLERFTEAMHQVELTGRELLALDDDSLKSIGFRVSFHRNKILKAISELYNTDSNWRPVDKNAVAPSTKKSPTNLDYSFTTTQTTPPATKATGRFAAAAETTTEPEKRERATCPHCQRKFRNQARLEKHLKSAHPEEYKKDEQSHAEWIQFVDNFCETSGTEKGTSEFKRKLTKAIPLFREQWPNAAIPEEWQELWNDLEQELDGMGDTEDASTESGSYETEDAETEDAP